MVALSGYQECEAYPIVSLLGKAWVHDLSSLSCHLAGDRGTAEVAEVDVNSGQAVVAH